MQMQIKDTLQQTCNALRLGGNSQHSKIGFIPFG